MSNPYKEYLNRNTIKLHDGVKYEGRILLKTTSRSLYKNKTFLGFAKNLESMISHWFKSVDKLRSFKNYFRDI